ncbi:MAG: hypothetical protein QJR02_01815 [Sinobacteraceae bacterium]|nr:hypothetical protein [Nevskiaceae bacterium]
MSAGSPREWMPSLGRLTLGLLVTLFVPAASLAASLHSRLRTLILRDCDRMLRDLDRDAAWAPWLVVAISLLTLIALHPFPYDDLARNLVSNLYGYDYRRMFWASPLLPSYNGYALFDRLCALVRGLPPAWQALPFQLLPFAVFLFTMRAALLRALREVQDRQLLTALLLVLLLSQYSLCGRFILGRPEIWFSAWLLSALLLPSSLWALLGLLLTPTYWFAPIYASGALLLENRPWKLRIGIAVSLGFAMCAIWNFQTDGEWLRGLLNLHAAFEGHDQGPQAEVDTVWLSLGPPLWVLLWALWKYRGGLRPLREDTALIAVIAIFLLPNMARYLSLYLPLAVLLLARAMARQRADVPFGRRGASALVVGLMVFHVPSFLHGPKVPDPDLLGRASAGDRVLAPQGATLYRAIFAGAHTGAQFAPAMDYGMTEREVRTMSVDLGLGKFPDCDALNRLEVKWVVEANATGVAPSCLELDSFDPTMRVWRVRNIDG